MIVRFTASARADIQNIFDYIAKDNPQVARRVVLTIEKSAYRLGDFPLSGRIGVIESTRELVLSRLPFIVVTDSTVDILGIFHAAQDRPRGGSWAQRPHDSDNNRAVDPLNRHAHIPNRARALS